MKTERLNTIDEAQLDGVAGGGIATDIGAGIGALIDKGVDMWEAGMSDFFRRHGSPTLAGWFKDQIGK